MQRSKKIKEPIPEEFTTLKEAAEIQDKHDLTDYWKFTKEVEGDIKVPPTPRYVPLEKEISEFITQIAKKEHISPETLVNLWLKERLLKQIKNAKATSISPSQLNFKDYALKRHLPRSDFNNRLINLYKQTEERWVSGLEICQLI